MKSREQISFLLTLKKILEGYDSENASSAMAKNVLKPPFHTAGPISRKVARARSKKNVLSSNKSLEYLFSWVLGMCDTISSEVLLMNEVSTYHISG